MASISVSLDRNADRHDVKLLKRELDTLPGVGEVIAQRIIEEREENGPFYYPEDLMNVKGIGEKTLEKLLSHIRLP